MKKMTLTMVLAMVTSMIGMSVMAGSGDKEADMSKPVQVFILLGQSNMLGFGKVKGEKDGTLENAVKNKKLYPYLVDKDGKWVARKDVLNVRTMNGKMFNKEFLTVPSTGKNVGVELGIGHALGDALNEPVMVLKSCIGNRSLGWDLLPPGTPRYTAAGIECPGYKETVKSKKDKTIVPFGEGIGWYAGKQYDSDIGSAKKILDNIGKYYPGAKKYEVAGFFWWQGDKDFRNKAHAAKYGDNLELLLKALRKDFDAPKAKMVIATLGQTKKGAKGTQGQIIDAMFEMEKKHPNEVKTVYTNPLSKGGSSSGHYNKNAETYMNVGEEMGKAMVELLKK